MHKKSIYMGIPVYALLLFFAIIQLYPTIWVILSAFKTQADMFTKRWGLPTKFVFESYFDIWFRGNVLRHSLNTMILICISIPITGFLASLAAYGLTSYRFKYNSLILYYFVGGYAIPPVVALIPTFVFLNFLHMLNTYHGLSLLYIASGMPFAVFLLQAFFRTIPSQLRDAARIDGCSEFGIFLRIFFPLARPGLAALVIFQFTAIWNEFLYAMVFLKAQDKVTLMVRIYDLATNDLYINYPMFCAGMTISVVPILVILLLGQKHFLKGVRLGAIKG